MVVGEAVVAVFHQLELESRLARGAAGGSAVEAAAEVVDEGTVSALTKVPVEARALGEYQLPAPPRPMWLYSCGEAAVAVSNGGAAADDDVVGWLAASRSWACGRKRLVWFLFGEKGGR